MGFHRGPADFPPEGHSDVIAMKAAINIHQIQILVVVKKDGNLRKIDFNWSHHVIYVCPSHTMYILWGGSLIINDIICFVLIISQIKQDDKYILMMCFVHISLYLLTWGDMHHPYNGLRNEVIPATPVLIAWASSHNALNESSWQFMYLQSIT